MDKSTKLKPIVKYDYSVLHSITKEEMWSTINKTSAINGIEGYNPGVSHFDHKKKKYDREILELNQLVWQRKAKYPPAILPKDKEGNPIPINPIRKNFIDDEINIAKSFYSPEKAEKYAESKGLIPLEKGKLGKSYLYSHDRETMLAKIERKAKFDYQLNEQQQERAEKVKEKQAEFLKTKKHWAVLLKEKYPRGNWGKGVRLGIMSDAEFVGEKLPFYNPSTKPGEEPKPDTKEFFPSINAIKEKSPSTKYCKDTVLSTDHIEKRNELITEKVEKVKERWEARNIKFSGMANENFNTIKNRGRMFFTYKNVKIII